MDSVLGWSVHIGLVKFSIAAATAVFLIVIAAETFASSRKGISAFQRGKYEEPLKHLG